MVNVRLNHGLEERHAPHHLHGLKGGKMEKIHKSDAEWRAELDPVQYHVLREAGTERAFAGKLTDETDALLKKIVLAFLAGFQ